MNLNAAIVGLGKAGLTIDLRKKNLIKSHSKAFFKHPKFNLIYSFEKEFKKREIFKKIYKKSSFQNLHSPCKLNPDIVSICVPTEDHKKCIKKVINNLNPKIILCEKPLSYSLKDSKYILKICEEKKVKIFVNYTRNTNKNFINLKKKIKKYNNIKGKVYYNNGFKNNASHYLNLMIFLFGNVVKFNNIKKKNNIKNDINIDVSIKFTRASIDFKYEKKPIKDMEFEHKKFQFKNYKRKYYLFNNLKKKNVLDKYQFEILDNIIKYINGTKNNLCTGKQAYKEQLIINKIVKKTENVS